MPEWKERRASSLGRSSRLTRDTYFVAARFDRTKNRIALSVYGAESSSWEHKPGQPGYAFDGILDDVRFHDAALTTKGVEKLIHQP